MPPFHGQAASAIAGLYAGRTAFTLLARVQNVMPLRISSICRLYHYASGSKKSRTRAD
jgi:uncharacterized Fe-S cluster-containing radical SAM superfamily enzyme